MTFLKKFQFISHNGETNHFFRITKSHREKQRITYDMRHLYFYYYYFFPILYFILQI